VNVKKARKFLSQGDRVKLMCQLRGREIEYKSKAMEVFNQLAEECSDVGKVEQPAKAQGKQVIMYLISQNK
jgi:translation initiation factor IF-3